MTTGYFLCPVPILYLTDVESGIFSRIERQHRVLGNVQLGGY